MAKKQTTQRIMDVQRGTVGSGSQVYAAVAASGPAVGTSPPPTDLVVTSNVLILSAQTPMARISLQWRKPLLAQEVRLYQVQVATDSGFTAGIIYHMASDTTISIDVVTNTSGIAYWFRVRVLSGGIVSDWSGSVTATTTADTTPAGQPTSLAWSWDGADLILSWVNPTNSNLKDVEVRIWNSSGKTVLYHTGYSAVTRYGWTLPQQRIDTGGSLDAAVYFELRSRTWSNVLGTATVPGTNPTNAAPSAPSSVSFIQAPGSITISVSATAPTDFQAYRYRIIQTLPSAADVTFDSPSALETYAIYAQATYQIGVKILDVYGQLSSETLSSATVVDSLTIGALRADVIYSDNDGNSDATLHTPLSNAILTSGGITYATSSTWNKWIRAERPLLDRYRTLTLSMTAASGTSSWYVRTSTDASTWLYFAGPIVGTKTLTSVANAAAAQAAPVSAASLGGQTTSKIELPSTVEARFVEVWIRNPGPANTRVDEFYPRRAVEADDIYVQNLSGISANLGTITAGTITGATIQTAASGARVLLDSNGITTYDSSNNVQITATTATNGVLTAGAGAIAIDRNGMRINSSTTGSLLGPTAPNALQFVTSSTVNAYVSDSYSVAFTPWPTQELGIVATGNTVKTFSTNAENYLTLAALSTNGGSNAVVSLNGESGLLGAAVAIRNDTAITGSLAVSTGVNVGSATGASTGNIATSGSVAFGASINAAVRLFAKGLGTTSGTYCFNAQNSAGTNIIYCRDDGLSNFISSAWSSDRRHKEQIRAITDDDLTRFRQLQPSHYIRTNGPGGPEYGLIAQDVQAVFPEWVVTDPDGYLSLRYTDAIPLLMAELSHLRQRVAALETI